MAVGRRVASALPLAGATAAAMVLTGVAVFAVTQAGCAEAGHYVRHDGVIELVGGCVEPADFPNVPQQRPNGDPPADPAPNQYGRSSTDLVEP